MTAQLRGLRVVVTGGARGIGRATARALLAQGATVVIGDLDGDLAKQVAYDFGARCQGFELDVTDRDSFTLFLDRVDAEHGGLDVLVNNAGIMPLGQFCDEDDAVTRRIVEVNLHGTMLGTKLAGARMRAVGHGHIVNVASAVGRVALAGAATYSATKYALVGLSEAVRAELRPAGVDVSVVLPMITNTELGAGLGSVRGQRTVEPEDVAAAIVRVIGRPRFETWVPASGYRLYKAMSLVPRSWAERVSRLVGAADVLADADSDARAAYERRARR